MSGLPQTVGGTFPAASGLLRRARTGLCLLLLLAYSAWGQVANPPAEPPARRILILASYHSGQPWTDALVQGIREPILVAFPNAEISVEYLDAKRYGRLLLPRKTDLMRMKYSGPKQDLLFLLDDDALLFYLDVGKTIWPETPAVFAGINDHSVLARVPRHWVTGITETFSLDPFVAIGMRAHPGVKRVFFLTDSTTTGHAMRETMRDYARRHPELQYVFLDAAEEPLPALLERLKQAAPGDLTVSSMFTADRLRSDYAVSATQTSIARASAAPVISPTTSDLGQGYLCGRMNNGKPHGAFAAALGLKVLRGVEPASIPIVEHDIIGLVVDHRVAMKWGIPDSAWPQDTVFVNRPPSSPATDRSLLVLGLVFIFAQTVIIAMLAVNMARRRKAEQALRHSETMLERAQQIARIGSWVRNLDTGQLQWSHEVYRVYGLTPGAIIPSFDYVMSRIHPDDIERVRSLIARSDARDSGRSMEYRMFREDGAERHLSIKAEFHRMSNGSRILEGTTQDITEIREMEAQVRQVQKMESVGQLAGGIAHDFNNLLTVINGYSQLLLRRMQEADPERRRVEEILRAGERAASLTRQLLAFGRRQVMNSTTVDLQAIITSMAGMLQTVLGESIPLQLHFENPSPVEVDQMQLEQVILNLVLNARDAMPAGGRLSISVITVHMTPPTEMRSTGLEPGEYTLLTVSDTGTGMDETTQARIFEPFYTTKPTGKGSGLGLSTAYGVIKQSGGHISVWSRTGVGTEFRIYLPVAPAPASVAAQPSQSDASPAPMRESVLLVEDQDSVRRLAAETLSALGYRVLEGANGEEALRLCRDNSTEVGLVVTDVVMPGMNGPQLVAELRKTFPRLQVLYISGYAGDALEAEKGHLLLKPFLPTDLAWKVREILVQPNMAEMPAAPPV